MKGECVSVGFKACRRLLQILKWEHRASRDWNVSGKALNKAAVVPLGQGLLGQKLKHHGSEWQFGEDIPPGA